MLVIVRRLALAKRRANGLSGRMASIDTSVGRIGVAEAGGGDGTPLLFLHGVGSDKSVWHPQLAALGRTRRCLAMDYPGYGESGFVAGAGHDSYAAAALALLDALGIGRAHVCGLSLGGVVAIAMHAAAPERCASLILADTFAVHPDGQAIHDRSLAAAAELGMRGLAEARVDALLAPAALPSVRSEVVETMAGIDPAAYAQGAAAVWLADQRARVAAIAVPSLILVGSADRITPPALSEDLKDRLPQAALVEIAGAGHLANLEQPAIFNRVVETFLSGLD
ncbi:alpha/beta fold hydrolase [Sphingomonas ginkgonis]|uniref:Alpha/beta fold hydrolase n=1 Tax=Sphingomonas ginkgonis TaxID=2315330 RepID=A0A429V7Y1_9SPHN|nr:alpha/beta fold hydrolase [Sphingomonas ginkgonis]RST30039.1 alpha/beta fold hydrolase [Sphingomonas ginkgonis]